MRIRDVSCEKNYKQNNLILPYNFKKKPIFSICFNLGSWELDRVNDALTKLQDKFLLRIS